jgi:signal transduction histidine kinase
MRAVTFDLSSPILHELGFERAAAEWLREQIGERSGMKTEFEDDGQPKPLSDDIRSLLFRDVRELLMNVVKHSHAKKVSLAICRLGSEIHVTVQDDGVGFDSAEAAAAGRRGGFGLFSIQEGLDSLGGRLHIESAPGRGCKVTLIAPLAKAASERRRRRP